MIYSSGKHEKLTADPHAWFDPVTGARFASFEAAAHAGRRIYGGSTHTPPQFIPRQAFDRPLANPVNPILREVREWIAAFPEDNLAEVSAATLNGLSDMAAGSPAWTHYGQPYLAHAEAVLERLANLAINE